MNALRCIVISCILACCGCDVGANNELAQKTLDAWVQGEDVERMTAFPQSVGATAAATLYVGRLRSNGPIKEALARSESIEVDGEKYKLVPANEKSAEYAHTRRSVKVIVTRKVDRRKVETALVVVVAS